MSITATVTASPITASASGGQVNASVASTSVSSSFTGGVGPVGPAGPQGPQGPQGIPGPATSVIDDLTDVTAPTPAAGDVLRYSNAQWRNFPEVDLTLDGGNW